MIYPDKLFTHGVIAVDKDENVLHFIGYFELPTEQDYEQLHKELQQDEELGLIGVSFTLEPASDNILKYFNNAKIGKP